MDNFIWNWKINIILKVKVNLIKILLLVLFFIVCVVYFVVCLFYNWKICNDRGICNDIIIGSGECLCEVGGLCGGGIWMFNKLG